MFTGNSLKAVCFILTIILSMLMKTYGVVIHCLGALASQNAGGASLISGQNPVSHILGQDGGRLPLYGQYSFIKNFLLPHHQNSSSGQISGI